MTSSLWARWATKDDLSYSMVKSSSHIKVKRDGTYSTESFAEFEILKDQAKETFSLYKIKFKSSSSNVKIIEAKVVNGDVVQNVLPINIVERSVAQNQGIDDTKEVQIPFPDLRVGSRIILKYVSQTHQVVVPNHFAMTLLYNTSTIMEQSQLIVETEEPLIYLVNDTHQYLHVQQNQVGNKKVLTAVLKRPFLRTLVDEKGSLKAEDALWLKFSSSKDWNEISQNLVKRFDNTLKGSLPKELESVIQAAGKYLTYEEKVNYFLGYITQEYNYVGDWRTLNGGFSPRSLEEIVKTKYGDCKDFSSLLAALIRKIGGEADIALVHRSNPSHGRLLEMSIPSMDVFNHAITRVKTGDKTYWLDPTNRTSFGVRYREDIAGKPVLVLDGKVTKSFIPLESGFEEKVSISKEIDFKSDNSGEVKVRNLLVGQTALAFTGIEQSVPQEKVLQALSMFSNQGERSSLAEVKNLDLKTKMYKDLDFSINYMANNIALEENNEKLIAWPNIYVLLQSFSGDFKNWSGDLYLGDPSVFERNIFLKDIFVSDSVKGCSVSSPWIDIKRDVELLPDGIRLKESIISKKHFIPQSSFSSTDFEIMEINMEKCASLLPFKYSFGTKKHTSPLRNLEAGWISLKPFARQEARLKYFTQVKDKEIKTDLSSYELKELLKKNIYENPKHIESYLTLAFEVLNEGYMSDNDFNKNNVDQAQTILLEGLKHNPGNHELFHPYMRYYSFKGEAHKTRELLPELLKMAKFDNGKDLIRLSSTYSVIGENQKALESARLAIQKSQASKEKSEAWFRYASIQYELKDYQECIVGYKNTISNGYTKNNYPYVNINLCLNALGQYDESLKYALEGKKIMNSGMINSKIAQTYIERGRTYLKKNELDLAESDFKNSLQYRSEQNAYLFLGKIAALKNDYERADVLFKEGVQWISYNPSSYFHSAASVFPYTSPKKTEYLKKLIEVQTSVDLKLATYYDLGKSLYYSKQTAEFVKAMEEGTRMGEAMLIKNPNEIRYAFSVGSLYGLHGMVVKDPILLKKSLFHLEKVKASGANSSNPRVIAQYKETVEALNALSTNRMPASVIEKNKKGP